MSNKYNIKSCACLSMLLSSRAVSKFRIVLCSLMVFLSIFLSSSSLFASSVSNEELLVLLQFAVENDDEDFLKDIITSLIDANRPGSYQILSAISKYHNAGKLDYALHNAIKANDLVASFILAFHCKDINKSTESEVEWTTRNGNSKAGCSRDGKNQLELAFWHDMDALIPYLIKRGADIFHMRKIGFVYEGEEDLDFIKNLFPDALVKNYNCLDTNKKIIATSHSFRRNIIGDAIAKNRMDIVEMLGKESPDWNRPCIRFNFHPNQEVAYTPLQYCLIMERDDIAFYLIMHGAYIE